MNVVFSGLYWGYLGVTAAFLYVGALAIRLATAAFDPTGAILHRYTCWWSQLYLRCLPGCRIRVEGREKIRAGIPYVLVANHQSLTDVMALSALAVPFKWVSKKEVFRIPCVGWNMYLNRYVCVDRGNVASVRDMMDVCRGWLECGVPLLIFPEGTRSRDGEIHDFHGGAFRLAVDSRCAVVPIVVDGTLGIYQGLRVSSHPGTITIRVLDPVPPDAGAAALRDGVFQRMQLALAEVRTGTPSKVDHQFARSEPERDAPDTHQGIHNHNHQR